MPEKKRYAIKIPPDEAIPLKKENRVKTITPPIKIFRRPTISAILAKGTWKTAVDNIYAAGIHPEVTTSSDSVLLI
ncbi:hypothetical protein AGMMS49574_19700 [Bacteroidia bacterium]|nr:hypothetical protein AGMMS49574_19700 [Bacteroidia bacterium]